MPDKPVVWAAAAAVLILGAACGGTTPAQDQDLVAAPQQPAAVPPQVAADPAVEPAVQPEVAPVAVESDLAVESGENAAPPAEAEAQPAPADVIPGRPSAPAAIDADFRSDPATLVGATGNPQLVEFFTFW